MKKPKAIPVSWVVARLGAAMHYAVPRILHQAGLLERFYTDFYANERWMRLFGSLPKSYCADVIERAKGRRATLPARLVRSYPMLGFEYYIRKTLARDHDAKSRVFLSAGKKFGGRVSRDGFGNAGAVYAFTTAALEILSRAKQCGLITVLEQTIAPRAVEEDLLAEEQRLYPGWEQPRNCGRLTDEIIERERQEWSIADLIICGSEFVREGMARCGASTDKCVVVPYGVEVSIHTPHRNSRVERPLRILTVGEAGLRKGVQYVWQTARELGEIAEFRWVGHVGLQPDARKRVERNINFVGAVPRNQVSQHFKWADVFFLPSMCEGSATVTYEALMSGLPVIATPNTGSVVVDGFNGFIVPVRDSQTMADRIRCLYRDRQLLSEMQERAFNSEGLSLQCYRHNLLEVLERVSVLH
jgi:glycosyltransferase involved in cell wall biosynthesis